jgi:hypothetical protein
MVISKVYAVIIDSIADNAEQHNVLVNDQGNPQLCDFGRSKILDHVGFITGGRPFLGGDKVYSTRAPCTC